MPYPWSYGDLLTASDLNAAVAAAQVVTATGGTTARTLADWFQGLDKTGAQWRLSDGATTGSVVYTAIFPGVTFADQFSASMLYPSTATTGQGAAVAAYFRNQAAASGGQHNAVGLFTAGTAEANDSASWGLNTLLQDAATRTVGTGTGRYLVNELDFNVMNPATNVIGLSVGGNSLAQPIVSNGYIVNPLGTGVRWGGGLLVQDNAVDAAISIGLYHATSGANVASAPIQLVTTDGSGTKQVIVVSATGGNTLTLAGTGGANLTVPGTGAFGGLSASGTVSGAGFTSLLNATLAAPPAIGAGSAAAATFTTMQATGSVTAGWNGGGAANAYLNSAAATYRVLQFQTAGVPRWAFYADNAAESGAAAGSNFNLVAYNDAGTFTFSPLTINRASGLVALAKGATISGGASTIDGAVVGATTPAAATVTQLNLTTSAGPNIRAGTGAASGTQPAGSLWLRTDGGVGTRLYVSAGGGVWNPVAGV